MYYLPRPVSADEFATTTLMMAAGIGWFVFFGYWHVLTVKDVPLLWGFVRLLAWDPIEGVLILQNKSVVFSDVLAPSSAERTSTATILRGLT